MDKSPEAFRTISEVAEALETPAHVLRFWESRFPQIRPVKRAGGRRYYRPSDVALLAGIKRLLHDEGMTIRGVQKILREQGIRHVSGLVEDAGLADDTASEDMVGEDRIHEIIPFPGAAPGDDTAAKAGPADTAPADQDGFDTAFPESLNADGTDEEAAFADLDREPGPAHTDSETFEPGLDVAAAPSTAEVVSLFPEEESDASVQFSLFGDEGEESPAAQPALPAAAGHQDPKALVAGTVSPAPPTAEAPLSEPGAALVRAAPPVAENLPTADDVEEAPFTEVEDWASAAVDDFSADLADQAPFENVALSVEGAAESQEQAPLDADPALALPLAEDGRDEPASDRPAIAARVRRMAESALDLDEPTATLAARLRALPLGSLNPKAKPLAEIAARVAALRARLGPPHAS